MTMEDWATHREKHRADTSVNYISGNKAAWEEAFEHRHPGWGEENRLFMGNSG